MFEITHDSLVPKEEKIITTKQCAIHTGPLNGSGTHLEMNNNEIAGKNKYFV